MILFQVYILICILFLAGKDSTSHRLKDKKDNDLTEVRIQRFHRDGAILNFLFTLPFIYFDPNRWYLYIIYTVLIRLSVFDLMFNYSTGLNYRFLGSTAWTDQQFIKIFGEEGAIKKSITFLLILTLLNIIL